MKNLVNNSIIYNDILNDCTSNTIFFPLFEGGVCEWNPSTLEGKLYTPKGVYELSYEYESWWIAPEGELFYYPQGAHSMCSVEEWIEWFYPQQFYHYGVPTCPSWAKVTLKKYLKKRCYTNLQEEGLRSERELAAENLLREKKVWYKL